MNNNAYNMNLQMVICGQNTSAFRDGVVVAVSKKAGAPTKGGYFLMNMKP